MGAGVGACPELPVDGVALLFGNDLAGSPKLVGSPPSAVTSEPLTFGKPDVIGVKFPEVFLWCILTLSVTYGKAMAESSHVKREMNPLFSDLGDTIFCRS